MSPTVRARARAGARRTSAGSCCRRRSACSRCSRVGAAIAVDALAGRRRPARDGRDPARSRTRRSRGDAAARRRRGSRTALRQPRLADVAVEPPEADGELDATLIALRRGRHVLPAPAARVTGPLGLGCWYHRPGEAVEVIVYPDLPAARRLRLAVRTGRFRDAGQALARAARPRHRLRVDPRLPPGRRHPPGQLARDRAPRPADVEQPYRVERDRDVVCVVDCGRLMAAPLARPHAARRRGRRRGRGRAVADEVGDRAACSRSTARSAVGWRRAAPAATPSCGRSSTSSRGRSSPTTSSRSATSGEAKRAFVLVLTDLLERVGCPPAAGGAAAARAAARARRRQRDRCRPAGARAPPSRSVTGEVYRAAVAAEVLDARARVAARLRHGGRQRSSRRRPAGSPAPASAAYLRAKARARL